MADYYAHVTDDGRKQTVEEHLRGCAELGETFASSFDAGDYGFLAGIMHDIGKYSEDFQHRLEGGPRVDHSSAGALECALVEQLFVGICVAGHHGGLPDFGNQSVDHEGDSTFVGRLKKAFPLRGKTYPGWHGGVPRTPRQPPFNDDYICSLWIRMLYSCLVDADFLDTESFMKNGEVDRGRYDTIDTLCDRLEQYTSKWNSAKTELNRIRNGIRLDCENAACEESGLFSLTVPTGGGKTVSSLAFALRHAKAHGMSRVIYVIPYTSIIEQNAAVFRSILGDDNVIEHHSEAESSFGEELTETQKRAALAAENWDAPVIVTTAVQFFESLYANKPSKCRKIHNIANSVVVFDEVQSIPSGHLLPCMAAVGTLVKYFGVSAVLCSATQPFVADLLGKYAPDCPVREICSNVDGLFKKLRRVTYKNAGRIALDELADEISGKEQVLCVVNKRRTAKELFDLIPTEGSFHLSTLMTPKDRKRSLDEIRERLSRSLPCRVVSTSLIEAGVDVDFPFVYREMTGLDSVVQAAGRCNREGKRPTDDSIVTVFGFDEKVLSMLAVNIGAAQEAFDLTGELGTKKSVDQYFRSYRSLIGQQSIDVSNAVEHLTKGIAGCRLPFSTVAEDFHLIDQKTVTVYIPTEENTELIERIRNGTADRQTYRAAGQYSVNIYENHYRDLYEAGDIEEIASGTAILVNGKLYDCKTGLSLSADSGRAEFA